MYKTLLIVLLLIILLLSAVSCQKAGKQNVPVTVTLDWTPNTNHTGLYVALEKGFFKQEGLDVKIVQPGQGYTDQIVATGKSEFGVSYQENVTRARAEGIPLVSVAAVIQHNTSGFAALKESGIQSVQDFEGKRYGSWDSPSEKAVLTAVMQNNNSDINKVTIVSGITDFFSTIGKTADFEWIYEGWDGIEAKLRKMELNYIPLKDLEPALDYYTPVLITSDNIIKTNPELVKRFVKAADEGYSFAIANPDEAAGILLKHAPELKPELVRASQKFLSTQYQADSPVWGMQRQDVWQNFADWMVSQKLLAKPIDVNSAYTNAFLPVK